jgi:hypothetical protein
LNECWVFCQLAASGVSIVAEGRAHQLLDMLGTLELDRPTRLHIHPSAVGADGQQTQSSVSLQNVKRPPAFFGGVFQLKHLEAKAFRRRGGLDRSDRTEHRLELAVALCADAASFEGLSRSSWFCQEIDLLRRWASNWHYCEGTASSCRTAEVGTIV